MAVRRAIRPDVATVRQRFAELRHAPYLPDDDDVAEYWEDKNAVAVMGDAGEFGQARYSELHTISTIVWLLPESMGIGKLAPLLLELLDGLWAIPEAQDNPLQGTFHSGLDNAGREDFGLGKAEAWQRMVNGTDRDGQVRAGPTKVEPVYNSLDALSGHRIYSATLRETRDRMLEVRRAN